MGNSGFEEHKKGIAAMMERAQEAMTKINELIPKGESKKAIVSGKNVTVHKISKCSIVLEFETEQDRDSYFNGKK